LIVIYCGNIGSGKTASAVRDIIYDDTPTYSNIITKKVSNNKTINSGMIVKKECTGVKKTGEKVYDRTLNVEFWKHLPKPLNVFIDEAHSIINSRRAMSKQNILMIEWLALLRRVVGSNDGRVGKLVLITQMPYRIDNISRDMAHQVRHHICHYVKTCKDCGYSWRETNEVPEPVNYCLNCGKEKLTKHSHVIEVHCFRGIKQFELWEDTKENCYYRRYLIHDIEEVFPKYDTLQWDNLFES